jgi:hypothetical protein
MIAFCLRILPRLLDLELPPLIILYLHLLDVKLHVKSPLNYHISISTTNESHEHNN